MPYTLKKNKFKYKNPDTGNYEGVDVVAERSFEDYQSALETVGLQQQTAVRSEGTTQTNAVTAAGTAAAANFPATAEACDTLAGDFAATYVPDQAYSVGDYCTYQYQLYQCKTAIAANTDHTFVTSHWNLITITDTLNDEVGNLKESLDNVIDTANIETSNTRGGWDAENGVATLTTASSGSYFALDPIPVTEGKTYDISIYANSEHPSVIIATYSGGVYNVISTKTVETSGRVSYSLTIPQNATHILLTKFGTQAATVTYQHIKTDKNLTEDNVPADAAATGTAITNAASTAAGAYTIASDIMERMPTKHVSVSVAEKFHGYWKQTNGVASQQSGSGGAYCYDPVGVNAGEVYEISINVKANGNTRPVIITDNNYNVLSVVDNPSTDAEQRMQISITIPAGGKKMLLTKYGANSKISVDLIQPLNVVSDDYIGLFAETGLTWDWWYTASCTDVYGNTYIGFISQDKKCGVMMRASDGTCYYKYLDVAYNNDDHNPMGVCIDRNGYVYAFGTLGHSYANKIAIYKSTAPYTIRCDFTNLSVELCEPTGATYKCTYSQAFIYYDGTTEYITDFFRIVSEDAGVCYGALQSTDGGQTWALHGVTAYSDPYIKFVDMGEGVLALCCTSNPVNTNRSIYLGQINVSDGAISSADGTSVGTWSTIANGTGTGATQEIYASCTVNARTDFIAYVTSTNRLRLLDARYINSTVYVLWAEADSDKMDWTYYLFDGTNNASLGKSGLPFYLYSGYLAGACFMNDTYIVVCRNVSGTKDGNSALFVYEVGNNTPVKKGIFEYLVLRPIPCANGVVAVCVGKYHDVSTTDDTGSFTSWELMPAFHSIL